MLSALLSACRLDVYGPGFQSPADLARNPGEFVERHGPYDLILADEFTIQNFDQAPSSRPLRFVNHACRYDRGLMMYGQRFQEFLANYRGRRSDENTSELPSLMRISYAVFCLKKHT